MPTLEKNTVKPNNSKSGNGRLFFGGEQTFFSPNVIQPKLTIGQPGDKYEQEADAMAVRVVNMSTMEVNKSRLIPAVQRTCSECKEEQGIQRQEEEEQDPIAQPQIYKEEEPEVQTQSEAAAESEVQTKPLRRKTENGQNIGTASLASQLNNSKGGGQPLPRQTNSFMSQAFGMDFSSVRVHTGSNSVQMNKDLNAKAFTHETDIYFNQGQYNPESSEGKRLLGHELTHVVQQGGQLKFPLRKPISRKSNGFDWIMRDPLPVRSTRPPCSGVTPIPVNQERQFDLGPIPAPASQCTFTPLFHIQGSSVRVIAHAENPPPGDWRITVFECPQRFAGGAECDRVIGQTRSASGSITSDLEYNYNPILWVSRNIFVRIRNGSVNSIPNVRLTLIPQGYSLDSIGEILHSVLDALGLIPVLGIIPDGVNAAFYLIEGDFAGAGISAAAMVPIFGQGAGITRLGIRVTRESVERLGRSGVERAIQEGVRGAGTRVLRRAPAQRVVAVLRNFSRRVFNAGRETFVLDREGMRHILERHHPRFWDGSVRARQSFFEDGLSIDDVVRIIQEVMSQNREVLIRRGTRRIYSISGTWGGRSYQVGLNNGRVGQCYPL